MFRFTIRDVLWLTVVVAMGVGWWVDKRHAVRAANEKSEALREGLRAALGAWESKLGGIGTHMTLRDGEHVHSKGDGNVQIVFPASADNGTLAAPLIDP